MFIDLLKKELERKNVTMEELSKEVGFNQPTIEKWEKGYYPNAETLIIICEYLSVSADYLLGLDPINIELTLNELKLLEHYRNSDDRGRENIYKTAEREEIRENYQKIQRRKNVQ